MITTFTQTAMMILTTTTMLLLYMEPNIIIIITLRNPLRNIRLLHITTITRIIVTAVGITNTPKITRITRNGNTCMGMSKNLRMEPILPFSSLTFRSRVIRER